MTASTLAEWLTTEELARLLNIKPNTLRVAHCLHGAYFGIKPIKLPNRMLRWPADALDQLQAQAAQ